jgi:hypothetical protein
MYDIIVFMLSYMISYMKHHDVLTNLSCLAAADRPQAQRADASDADHDPDRSMDSDEERDFADQGPLTDMDMEEDAEMLALLLKHMPSCIDAADIEQLVRDIPVQPPVAIPVRTVQEAVRSFM